MFLVVSLHSVESVAVYSAALKAAKAKANETKDKVRIYRMPTVVEEVVRPDSPPEVSNDPPAQTPQTKKRKKR
jgi:hypothetical protein